MCVSYLIHISFPIDKGQGILKTAWILNEQNILSKYISLIVIR